MFPIGPILIGLAIWCLNGTNEVLPLCTETEELFGISSKMPKLLTNVCKELKKQMYGKSLLVPW